MKDKEQKRIEDGRKGGQKRWKGISKEKRSQEMRQRANDLWKKIRAGKLTKE